MGGLEPPSHRVRAVRSDADLEEWLTIVRDCGWYEDVEPARRLDNPLGYEGLYLAEDGGTKSGLYESCPRADTGWGEALGLTRLSPPIAGTRPLVRSPTPDLDLSHLEPGTGLR